MEIKTDPKTQVENNLLLSPLFPPLFVCLFQNAKDWTQGLTYVQSLEEQFKGSHFVIFKLIIKLHYSTV